MQPKRLGILVHPNRPAAVPVGEALEQLLSQHGVRVWRQNAWDAHILDALIADSDVVVAIGGDGTMLRAARLCARADVPVFGINTGHLGFLTEVGGTDGDWQAAIEPLLAGHYWIEQRMMITCETWHAGELLSQSDALNDVVLRGAVARSVYLEMYIDGGWATTYHADGLIIATPTGSTAYALAAGGPILPPELKNILVTAIAPHLSMDRAMVLSEGAAVEVVVASDTSINVELTVDGEDAALLKPGDRVLIHASERHSDFIRLRERNYFYRSLLDRMEPRIRVRQHEQHEAAKQKEYE